MPYVARKEISEITDDDEEKKFYVYWTDRMDWLKGLQNARVFRKELTGNRLSQIAPGRMIEVEIVVV